MRQVRNPRQMAAWIASGIASPYHTYRGQEASLLVRTQRTSTSRPTATEMAVL
jgi:hypothetical protein